MNNGDRSTIEEIENLYKISVRDEKNMIEENQRQWNYGLMCGLRYALKLFGYSKKRLDQIREEEKQK